MNPLPLKEWELSTRAHNVLSLMDVRSAEQLRQLSKTNIRAMYGAGKKTADEIAATAASHGFALATDPLWVARVRVYEARIAQTRQKILRWQRQLSVWETRLKALKQKGEV